MRALQITKPHQLSAWVRDRNLQIWRERQAGDTYEAIAERHALSVPRVQTICAREELLGKFE